MGPVRDAMNIEEVDLADVRPINAADFAHALSEVRASVAQKDLGAYEAWNREYGSFR